MICRKPPKAIRIALLIAAVSLLHSSLAIALTPPADHLLPPPLLPVPQRLTHSNAPAYASQPQPDTVPSLAEGGVDNAQQSGFMTRIARWFGFGHEGAGPREQQLSAGSHLEPQFKAAPGKQAYLYPKPNQPLQQQQNGKAPCNLCNKYPWVPMLPPNIQYTPGQLHHQQQQQGQWGQPQQNLEIQASQNYLQKQPPPAYPTGSVTQQLPPVRQRAVQFNFPSPNLYQPPGFQSLQSPQQKQKIPAQHTTGHFVPIPIPNLSLSALPPLYNAQPFRPIYSSTQSTITEQQLPSTESAHFAENIGAHSELQPDRVIPTQIPPTTSGKDASFEIVRSHQLTDFVSSVEYPATYVQSQSFDLSGEQMPENHKPATVPTNTVKYQHEHFAPNLHNHIPASQILTELGSFGSGSQNMPQRDSTLPVQTYEQTTSLYQQPQFESQSLIVHSQQQQNEPSYESSAGDNFPSASSHNLTAIHQSNNVIAWNVQPNEFYYTTTEPQISTQTPQQSETDFITERLQDDSTIEFVPSLQTEVFYEQHHNEPPKQLPPARKRHRDRDTPKRLLDSPIQYNNEAGRGSPRPFTRDPSELDYRLGSPQKQQHSNHAYANEVHQKPSATWFVTPAPSFAVSSAAPTPTSTYSAIDASGQYAGMSPPNLPQPGKGVHQIIIPYTTKNHPRPFEPTRGVEITPTPGTSFDKWSHSNGVELHEQQESKKVTSATEAPPNTRRTTKYLTKILASNLRELLKREHEVKNRSHSYNFDFSKLQKNIDGWTEQEYTSLSHRPSTPTIRGRSKHIPTAYLTTTTPTPRQAKTTKGFDAAALSTSINNLEPLLLDRGAKRFEYAPIDDNHLQDFYDTTSMRKRTSSSTTPTTTTSTTTTPSTPYYIRAVPTQPPIELWQNAKVSISPQTKEKVYVVTPQPRFFPQRTFVTYTEAPLPVHGSSFKSPRFLVRPTPGNGTSSASTSSSPASLYAPELFGLMGLSAYVPAEPVEINDGNSKVITIVTPSGKIDEAAVKALETKRSRPAKPTMSPSPR